MVLLPLVGGLVLKTCLAPMEFYIKGIFATLDGIDGIGDAHSGTGKLVQLWEPSNTPDIQEESKNK